jgi:hypothetical protein
MKLDELLPSLRLLLSSCTSCMGLLLLLLLRVSRGVWQFSLARSLVLGASKFHEADSMTTVPNLLLLLATQNLSLQFQFPDLQVHREAFAEEETDGERQRQRDRRNGKFRVLCVCGAVDGGNGGKMGPVLACSATRVALPESMSWRMDGGETVPSSAVPGCALRY